MAWSLTKALVSWPSLVRAVRQPSARFSLVALAPRFVSIVTREDAAQRFASLSLVS